MSGVRRKSKYRKGVEADVLDSLPEPKEGELIVRVVASRGGNLIEVETSENVKALCRLPNRYRKVVWVKRGTLLIVDSCTEDYITSAGEEGKVKFVVNNVIFTDDQIKHLRKTGHLPAVFDVKDQKESQASDDLNDDPLLRVNRNRRPDLAVEESSSDDDDDDDKDDEDGEGQKQHEEEQQNDDNDEDDDNEE